MCFNLIQRGFHVRCERRVLAESCKVAKGAGKFYIDPGMQNRFEVFLQ